MIGNSKRPLTVTDETVVATHLIVTVHGIRTYGHWQERLEKLVTAEAGDSIEFVNYKLGYFSVIAFMLPIFRWLVVRKFRMEFVKLCARRRRDRIDLVGHSFGTHVIGWAIAGLDPKSGIVIDTVILAGSVLRAGFPWRDLIGHRVKRVINDCGTGDKVLLLSQFCVLFTGMAGRTGFSGATSNVFRNRYSEFGHSGYFEDKNRRPSDDYMIQFWVPLLQGSGNSIQFDQRRSGPLDGLMTVLANNAEPVKLMVYLTPVLVLLAIFLQLYREADRQRTIAVSQRDQALLSQSQFLAEAADRSRAGGDSTTAELLALEALPRDGYDRPYSPQAEGALFAAWQTVSERFVLQRNKPVRTAMFSPDGKRLLISSGAVAELWNLEEGKVGTVFRGHTDAIVSARFSPNGRQIVTASADQTVRIWDADSGSSLYTLSGHVRGVWTAAYSPDGHRIVTTSDDDTTRIWDAESGEAIAVIGKASPAKRQEFQDAHGRTITIMPPINGDRIYEASFSLDAERIVTDGDDFTAKIFSAKTGRLLMVLQHTDAVQTLEFSSDGSRIVTASRDGVARVWDAGTGQTTAVFQTEGAKIAQAHFSSDGHRLLTTSTDRIARIWDVESTKVLVRLAEHPDGIEEIAFSADGRRVLTSCSDLSVRIWDASTGQRLAILSGHTSQLTSATFSPNGRTVVTASSDGTARIWDVEPEKAFTTFEGHDREVEAADFSPNGLRVVTASNDHTARVWDAKTGNAIFKLEGHDHRVRAASFSPDGRQILTASWDSTARLWDAESGTLIKVFKGHEGQIWAAAFSPDGRLIATGADDQTARVWDVASGQTLIIYHEHFDTVRGVMFSRNGQRLVSSSDDHTARIWDVNTGKTISVFEKTQLAALSPDDSKILVWSGNSGRILDIKTNRVLATFNGPPGYAEYVAFSPDGRRVVTAFSDKAAYIWDAETGKMIVPLRGHASRLNSAVFSRDGQSIATSSNDNTARIWRVFRSTRDLVHDANRAVPRCLTQLQRSAFALEDEPPAWCIELEKWPNSSVSWKRWLVDRKAGRTVPLPTATAE
ncbi:WD40 repeat domain-containing protein [Bradyrhizobium sp. AZCC 2289]|uniref:WD40 repeat domain-containing protein n=1 Tax=Bradyrhizobium sp. AZCC 2289 TaxID=3117026 RepID=UPI002FF1AD8A